MHICFIFASICKDPPPVHQQDEKPLPKICLCMETMSNNDVGQMKETTIYDLYEARE